MKIVALLVSVFFLAVFLYLTPKSKSNQAAVKRFLVGFSVPVIAVGLFWPPMAIVLGVVVGFLRVLNYDCWSDGFKGLMASVFMVAGSVWSLIKDI